MKPDYPDKDRYVLAALGVAKGLRLACLQGNLWEFQEAEGRDESARLSTGASSSGRSSHTVHSPIFKRSQKVRNSPHGQYLL